jgi:hypothetical protein
MHLKKGTKQVLFQGLIPDDKLNCADNSNFKNISGWVNYRKYSE